MVYSRVSTANQADKGLSLDVQEKACKEALAHDGFKLLKVIRDEGQSGGSLNRPGIQEIISLTVKQEINALYLVSSDRLNRNTEDFLYLRKLFRKNKVELKYVYQQNTDGSAVSQTMDTIMASFNEMQRLVISEKVKKTLHAKATAGFFPSTAPLGYLNVNNPDQTNRFARKIIVPDPKMATLITEAFKLYASGDYTGYDLGDLMYQKGLRAKTGAQLSHSRFYDLLKNKIYIGELHWGEIHVTKSQHEPLTDIETFNRVQMVMGGHNRHACRRRKYQWLLGGFLYCYKHQKRYTAEWHFPKNIAYYHCTNKSGCGKYSELNDLENRIAEKFKELEFNRNFIDRIINKAKEIYYQRRNKYQSNKQGLVNQKTAIEAKKKVLEDKLLEQIISDEDFTVKRKEIKEQLDNIEDRLAKLEDTQEIRIDIAQEILRFTKNIYDAYFKASPLIKRYYLNLFWERFEIENGVIIKSTPTLLFRELLRFEQVSLKKQKALKWLDYREISNVIKSDIAIRR